jgi:hypothetical protein
MFHFNLKTMKKIALTFGGLAVVLFSIAQELAYNDRDENRLDAANAAFGWTETTYEFGQIKVGVPVSYEFTFTNTGEAPLVIASVQASCGCTVTSYSKDPIEPGNKGFVKATYNAAKLGQFSKTVTVNANTDESLVQLTIRGEVVE